MSSCDDDFPLLPTSPSASRHCSIPHSNPHHLPPPHAFKPTLHHHHHHHHIHHHQDEDSGYNDDDYGRAFAPPPQACFGDVDDDRKRNGDNDDAQKVEPVAKRREREELSDDGTSPYALTGGKKQRGAPAASSSGDYRKDREEWSDSAIGCLLDTYTDKYIQLNRGNLRGRDWEEVATIVSERCDKQKSCKSVEQCKNKVDNLKKRYKAERQRLSSGSLASSHWPWFKKMEQIVGYSTPAPYVKNMADDDKSAVAGSTAATAAIVAVSSATLAKQPKRYTGTTPGTSALMPNLKMKSLSIPRWRRVVFKISGATFAGEDPQNIDPKVTMMIAKEIAIANHRGVEVAVVVGGSNIFCGDTWATTASIDRTTAYQIGMMATVMNSILLQACLEKIGVPSRIQTAFWMPELAEPYIRRRAIRHLEKARVVIFGGVSNGTAGPIINTDTAAVLKASEINADAVLKGTTGDTMYECSSRNSNNFTFEHISFRDYVSRGITAFDITTISFCEENNIPVVFFNLFGPGNISKALCGEPVGTLIDQAGAVS